VKGSNVCATHGAFGGRAGKAAAQDRFAAAELIAEYLRRDPRSLPEVLQDALHTQDSIMLGLKTHALEGGEVTADDLDRLAEASRVTSAVGTAMARLGFEQRRLQIAEREVKAFIAALDGIRDAAELALTPAQRRQWDVVCGREIKAITAGNGAS
jgi:hypothetical protein